MKKVAIFNNHNWFENRHSWVFPKVKPKVLICRQW